MAGFTQSDLKIFQMVYVSTATSPLELDDIQAIERISIFNNQKMGVTGLLTYCDCKFIQFLEGQKSSVDEVFSVIKNDSRHHSIDILRQSYIEERQFSGWHMKYTNVDDIHIEHGAICHKIFDTQTDAISAFDNAQESMAILMAFKNSCSEQYYNKPIKPE